MPARAKSPQELFLTALEVPIQERTAFLDRVCEGNVEVRRMVESLLRSNEQLGRFMEGSPLDGNGLSAGAGPTSQSQVAPQLAAGTRLGRYVLMELLGSGGMGAVYRAQDEKLDRAVAVKVLSAAMLTSPAARRRFHKEALALARLGHTSIAAVYDAGEQDGIDYLVMECVEGESLASKLRHGPLSVTESTHILLQIAQALEEAHERGIVHRDLKPANVMITPRGKVKVLDFGIAKLLSHDGEEDEFATLETRSLIGTPAFMSPEQARDGQVDARTDLWSLGVMYYQCLTGRLPFNGGNGLIVLRAILEDTPSPPRTHGRDVPPLADSILAHTLEKDPQRRYQSATECAAEASRLLAEMNGAPHRHRRERLARGIAALTACAVLLGILVGAWFYHRAAQQRWARNEALPHAVTLLAANKPIAAFLLMQRAKNYLPSDPELRTLWEENTAAVSVASTPSGATVEVKDYLSPDAPWHSIGVTPLNNVRLPKGYLRWRVSKAGVGQIVEAPPTAPQMNFALSAARTAPAGMVPVPGGTWGEYIAFVGWIRPFDLPAYFIDRYEVTNREYQRFVDGGGYQNPRFWPETMTGGGRELTREAALRQFRDTTGRPGPSTWAGGHYPEGTADLPVGGVSWFEATAYAAFKGESLPVLSQWYKAAPPELAEFVVPESDVAHRLPARVGKFPGVGPYGTYDMAGNVREWAANPLEGDTRYILGGSWRSPAYMYFTPEAASPFDRSEDNGFRCVRSAGPLPAAATASIKPVDRDFTHVKPASDAVFRAYQALYDYDRTPLNAVSEGVVKETLDWREEKVSFDTGYRGERMSAFLFLPKNVRPPLPDRAVLPQCARDVHAWQRQWPTAWRSAVLRLHHPERPGGHVSGLPGHL